MGKEQLKLLWAIVQIIDDVITFSPLAKYLSMLVTVKCTSCQECRMSITNHRCFRWYGLVKQLAAVFPFSDISLSKS